MTSAWPAIALGVALLVQHWPDTGARLRLEPSGGAVAISIAVAVLAAAVLVVLLRGWRTTTYRFDRQAGTIEVTHAGPLRARAVHKLGLSGVSTLLERRSSGRRTLELVLDDGSALVLAREEHAGAALDRIARDVGGLLGRPLVLDVGVLIANRFEIEQRLGALRVNASGVGAPRAALAELGEGPRRNSLPTGRGSATDPRETNAALYRALDRATGAHVALRLVPMAGARDGFRAERFERELARLKGIAHPLVAPLVSHGCVPGGQGFVVTGWVEGEELSQVLARGALGLSESLRVLTGAARALAALHAAGIVHGHLGAASFLVSDAGSSDPTLVDIGAEPQASRYLAPEQVVDARELTPQVDVFALGCLFYACLVGEAPFGAARPVSSLARIRFDAPEPLRALRPGVPEAWAELTSRLLAKDTLSRPVDASALLLELERLPRPGLESGVFVRRAREVAKVSLSPVEPIGVAVVLARPAPLSPASAASAANAFAVAALASRLRQSSVTLERLSDGSLIACAASLLGASEPLRAAACAAACLQELLPDTTFALACAGAREQRTRVGDAVDAAARLLERAPVGPGIHLDSTSAERLDSRAFDVDHDAGVLRGERLALDPSRALLGKPTAFAGRGLELMELETFVRHALAGSSGSSASRGAERFAWVIGPAGIGKSRLAAEIVRRLPERQPNSVVLRAAGDPLRTGAPYLLLRDALCAYAELPLGTEPSLGRQRVERLCGKVEAAVRGRVRDFLGELCGVPFSDAGNAPLSAARSDPRVMRDQIRMAFRAWLASESTERALLLVLEDVQWGDALTLELLTELRNEPDAARLCVLAFARPEVEQAYPVLFGERAPWSLVLGPLHAHASQAFVQAVLGRELGSDLVSSIAQRAGGDPLLLEELLRARVARHPADAEGGPRAALAARLSLLGPEARRWLGLAGVIGPRFWTSALQELGDAPAGGVRVERWLDLFVELELLRKSEPSRRVGQVEYVFRQALLAEVAEAALDDDERRAAHLRIAAWLEARGEPDAMLLARHVLRGGAADRAIALYVRAARQSLAQHDSREALARASLGQAAGASGAALGELLRIQASACHSLGHWTRASQLGLDALELLPFGSSIWCSNVELLMDVLANIGDFKRSEALSEDLRRLVPKPEARTAHVRALHAELYGYAVSADHERGRNCLAFIDGLGGVGDDVVARGQTELWRAVFAFLLGHDATAALQLAERAEADLRAGQVQYRLSMACSLQSFIYWGLGRREESQHVARRARAIAVDLEDAYHTAIAEAFLALSLSEQSEPERLLEAERCAKSVVQLHVSPLFEATARSLNARIALMRGDFVLAAADSRRARAGFASMPPYALMASATLLEALTRQGLSDEALAVAHDDLRLLDSLGGPVCSDVMFGVAAAEALFESGNRASAASVLHEALRQIEQRSGKIADAELRQAYLTGRREVRRASELEQQWLVAGTGLKSTHA